MVSAPILVIGAIIVVIVIAVGAYALSRPSTVVVTTSTVHSGTNTTVLPVATTVKTTTTTTTAPASSYNVTCTPGNFYTCTNATLYNNVLSLSIAQHTGSTISNVTFSLSSPSSTGFVTLYSFYAKGQPAGVNFQSGVPVTVTFALNSTDVRYLANDSNAGYPSSIDYESSGSGTHSGGAVATVLVKPE